MNEIHGIGRSGEIGRSADAAKHGRTEKSEQNGFKDMLAGYMKDVNDMQAKADQSLKKMVAGEITDVHQVMNTVNEANTAFNMMMEIRNKVLEAYNEVMRMRL